MKKRYTIKDPNIKNFVEAMDGFFNMMDEPNFEGMFNRGDYYSQTEVLKTYKVSSKRYQELLEEHGVEPIRRPVQMEGYEVNTLYVLKEDLEKLNLEKRS
ncbi:MAG: hypothetical protein EOO97_00075 [Pedobacter sp.]|nr:MAG: hypothetical protein EOO97_00075 [Pedobacter sp.]